MLIRLSIPMRLITIYTILAAKSVYMRHCTVRCLMTTVQYHRRKSKSRISISKNLMQAIQ